MQEIDLTESVYNYEQKYQKNEFLDQASFSYEVCPYCERNFFIGKLKYHLKLCKVNNPMTKSPLRKIKRSYLKTPLDKILLQNDIQQRPQPKHQSPDMKLKIIAEQNKFKKCQYCSATFPSSVIDRHSKKCNMKPIHQNVSLEQMSSENYVNPEIMQIRSQTKIDFNQHKQKIQNEKLPRIRNSAKQKQINKRKYISTDLKQLGQYTVKIREQLSCFKKALEVQKIQCPYCSRKFSNEASLRHIPICEKLKSQQKNVIVFKKHSKSEVYKLNLPHKKNYFIRAGFTQNTQKNDDKKYKLVLKSVHTARVGRQKNTLSLFGGLETDQQKSRKNILSIKQAQQHEKLSQNLKIQKHHQAEDLSFKYKSQKIPIIQKNITKVDILPMNMTFSKNFIQAKDQQKQQKQYEIDEHKNVKFHQPLQNEEETSNAINEFLSVRIKC